MKFTNSLSRRHFLRGAGTALIVPPLLGAVPRRARAAAERAAATGPKRLILVHLPAGGYHEVTDRSNWEPRTTGKSFALAPSMAPLASLQDKLLILSNMQNDAANRADNANDRDLHTIGMATMFTQAHLRVDQGRVDLGISMDQVYAASIKGQTNVGSLHLGMRDWWDGLGTNHYDARYSNAVSYLDAYTAMPNEHDPQQIFDKYFAGAKDADSRAKLAYQRSARKSVLDGILGQANALRATLSADDAQRFDQYLTGVRSVESQLTGQVPASCSSGTRPSVPGNSEDYQAKTAAHMDLMVLALQCDLTRVLTYNFGPGHTDARYSFLSGVNDGHHNLSHSGPNKQVADIVQWELKVLSRFWSGLQASSEGGQSILDNSVTLATSEINGGNNHGYDNIPVLVVGSGGGFIDTGRHVRAGNANSLGNLSELELAILQGLGCNIKSFGGFNVTRAMTLTA